MVEYSFDEAFELLEKNLTNAKKNLETYSKDLEFIKDQITSVEYIRNKIVVAFKDSSKFNPESLKDFGATGINIIGDKIKFYFDNDQTTKKVYDNLKKHIS